MKHLVFDVRFRIEDVLEYVRLSAGDPALGIDNVTVHFVHLREPDHPTWRAVPRVANGALHPDVVVIHGDAKDWPLLQSERKPEPNSAHPHVVARLPEVVCGRVLGCASDNQGELLVVLKDTIALLTTAAALKEKQPSVDSFDAHLLLAASCPTPLHRRQYEGMRYVFARALLTLECVRASEERARGALAKAKTETIPFLAFGLGEDGFVQIQVQDAQVVWVVSDEECCGRLAREERGADVVVQRDVGGHRVLVIARDRLGPTGTRQQHLGTLLAVAASLRNAEAVARRGGSPFAPSEDACAAGNVRLGGVHGVFTLSISGDVVGNWGKGAPWSTLPWSTIETCIRSVIDATSSLARKAVLDDQGRIHTAALAAACMPETRR